MPVTSPSHIDVLAALRGDPTNRPVIDRRVAAGLRGDIEAALATLASEIDPTSPLVIRPSSFRVSTPSSPTALIRGTMIAMWTGLIAAGASASEPFEEGLELLASERPDLSDVVVALDDEERARLRADVDAHYVTLRRALHHVPTGWSWRAGVRAYQRLGLGEVIARDSVDLMLGSTTSETAQVALLDVTTGVLGPVDERVARYHALLQTLRTGVAPLVTAVFSTATGTLWSHRVDDDLLSRAVAEFVGCVKAVAA
jgi:hypothetical protein